MSRAMNIALEYLEGSDRRARVNSLTALRVIGSDQALEKLVEAALKDSQNETQEAAQEQLSKCRGAQRSMAAKILGRAVESTDDERGRKNGYRLLGVLRSQDTPVPRVDLPLLKRLKLAWSVFPTVFAKQGGRRWYRGLVPAAIGGMTATFVFLLYLSYQLDTRLFGELGLKFFLWGLLVTPLLGFFSAMRVAPIVHYPYRKLGLLVEAARSSIFPLAPALIAFVVVGLIQSFEGESAVVYSLVAIAGFLGIPIARVGTALGFGHTTTATKNFFIQTACGSGASFLYMSFVVFIAGVLTRYGWGGPLREFTEVLWAFMIPTSVALAVAFAVIETEAFEKAGRVRPWTESPLIIVLLLVSFLTLMALVARPRNPQEGDPRIGQVFELLWQNE